MAAMPGKWKLRWKTAQWIDQALQNALLSAMPCSAIYYLRIADKCTILKVHGIERLRHESSVELMGELKQIARKRRKKKSKISNVNPPTVRTKV